MSTKRSILISLRHTDPFVKGVRAVTLAEVKNMKRLKLPKQIINKYIKDRQIWTRHVEKLVQTPLSK